MEFTVTKRYRSSWAAGLVVLGIFITVLTGWQQSRAEARANVEQNRLRDSLQANQLSNQSLRAQFGDVAELIKTALAPKVITPAGREMLRVASGVAQRASRESNAPVKPVVATAASPNTPIQSAEAPPGQGKCRAEVHISGGDLDFGAPSEFGYKSLILGASCEGDGGATLKFTLTGPFYFREAGNGQTIVRKLEPQSNSHVSHLEIVFKPNDPGPASGKLDISSVDGSPAPNVRFGNPATLSGTGR